MAFEFIAPLDTRTTCLGCKIQSLSICLERDFCYVRQWLGIGVIIRIIKHKKGMVRWAEEKGAVN